MVLCFTLSVGWSDGNAFQVLMDLGVLDPKDHFSFFLCEKLFEIFKGDVSFERVTHLDVIRNFYKSVALSIIKSMSLLRE